MAVGKEIRNQIGSVKNTQKITSAMELVAASKMRKAQHRMRLGKPYMEKIWDVAAHISQANSEYQHPWFKKRDDRNVGVIVVSTDRGLCAGLNINLFKNILQTLGNDKGRNSVFVTALGSKGLSFFSRVYEIQSHLVKIPDEPALDSLLSVIHVQIQLFTEGKIDRVYLGYNEFINSITQKPKVIQILPLVSNEQQQIHRQYQWDYLYEPNALTLLDELLQRYIEVQIYQAVVENKACEQAARMVAMKSATDNAGEIVNDLEIQYNKARQASITQEISEIVGGAAAL